MIQFKLSEVNKDNFDSISLDVCKYQYNRIPIYRAFCNHLNIDINRLNSVDEIPFLPIQFFKTNVVAAEGIALTNYFESSGTETQMVSKHYIESIDRYIESIETSAVYYFSDLAQYHIVALLPHYLERPNSSLVYMVNHWLEMTLQPATQFFLHQISELIEFIQSKIAKNEKVLLIGISFALLDLIDCFQSNSDLLTIIETGGMKGRRAEIPKNELFQRIQLAFPKARIMSEYGMCELFSQAYADSDLIFHSPPWMRLYISELQDPLSTYSQGQGVAKIIDLANVNSCSFVETQDMIRLFDQHSFEIIGRKDNSDIRGCSLLY